MICQGKSRRTGEPCRKHAIVGREYCRLHGGKIPRGWANPTTKSGRYSKDLPTRLLAGYEKTRFDANLLELRDEIAVIEERVRDLLKRVDTGESGHLWEKIRKSYTALENAIRDKDTDSIRVSLYEMKGLVDRGTSDYHAWEEVSRQIDRRQRLVESERRRAVELQQIGTAEQFLLFAAVYRNATLKVIKDTATLAQLQSELAHGFRESGIEPPHADAGHGTVH